MTLLGQFLLLVVFSLALGAVVSGYRDDNTRKVLVGTLRRAFLFALAVVVLGATALAAEALFLHPG